MEDIKKIQEFFSKPVKENSRRSPDFILTEPAEIKYTESFGSGIKAPGVLHHANEGVFLGAEGAYIIVLPGGTFYVDEDKEEAIRIYPLKDQSREFQLALDYTPFSPKFETWKSWIKEPKTLEEDKYNPDLDQDDEEVPMPMDDEGRPLGEADEVTRYSGFIRNPEDPDSEPFNPTGSVAEFREDLRALFGKFKGDLKNPEFIKGVAEIMVNWKSLLRSQLEENKPVANVNRHIKAIQIQLDQLGVKYEMSGNPYKPFKAVYKPINKDDKWYDNFEDIVFRYNLGGVVKTSMNEGAEDIMDAYNDVLDLVKKHSRRLSDDDSYAFGLKLKSWFNKNILDEATKDEETTFHKKLDKLVHDTFGKRKGELEEGASTEEKRIAMSAIKRIAKYRGVSEDEARNDLVRAAKELGSLKEAVKDMFETIKLGQQLNEELCDKGKRYIKARQAAGEKSSAYLSGRAVRVCKGQIEWPKKGKKKK